MKNVIALGLILTCIGVAGCGERGGREGAPVVAEKRTDLTEILTHIKNGNSEKEFNSMCESEEVLQYGFSTFDQGIVLSFFPEKVRFTIDFLKSCQPGKGEVCTKPDYEIKDLNYFLTGAPNPEAINLLDFGRVFSHEEKFYLDSPYGRFQMFPFIAGKRSLTREEFSTLCPK